MYNVENTFFQCSYKKIKLKLVQANWPTEDSFCSSVHVHIHFIPLSYPFIHQSHQLFYCIYVLCVTLGEVHDWRFCCLNPFHSPCFFPGHAVHCHLLIFSQTTLHSFVLQVSVFILSGSVPEKLII